MDIVRRNTDYALRAMVNLAEHFGNGLVTTKQLASDENISYQLLCKLMQRLHKAGLVESSMGPRGGFHLSREPAKISLLEVIGTIQGTVKLNRCLLDDNACDRKRYCMVSEKLAELQKNIDNYLSGITLDKVLRNRGNLCRKK